MSRYFCAFILLATAAQALAGSAAESVADGNRAYAEERYDTALEAYLQAGNDEDYLPYLNFNQGAAYYKLGDYEKALAAFEQAAVRAKDPLLEALSHYGMGDCAFQQGQAAREGDLAAAKAALESSMRHFKTALKRDPLLELAKQNLGVAERALKEIYKLIEQQPPQSEPQQGDQEQQDASDKLDQLIQQQQENREQTQELAEQEAASGESSQAQRDEAANDQQATREETESLAEQMPQQDAQDSSPREHLEQAAERQRAAEEHLRDDELEQAAAAQEQAKEELEKARESLGDQSEPQQSSEDEEESTQESPDSSEEQYDEPSENETGNEEEMEGTPLSETARDILEEEQENRERRTVIRGRYQVVDKDW